MFNKYHYCHDSNCEKFKEAEEKALRINNSAFDAAIDMWNFVDECCVNCERLKKAEEEDRNTSNG